MILVVILICKNDENKNYEYNYCDKFNSVEIFGSDLL
jgi:hypothetical protein